jgi:hypothetical protein
MATQESISPPEEKLGALVLVVIIAQFCIYCHNLLKIAYFSENLRNLTKNSVFCRKSSKFDEK